MTIKAALLSGFSSQVFLQETLVSTFLVLLVLLAYFILKTYYQMEKLIFAPSAIIALVFGVALIIAWTLNRFVSNTSVPLFLAPAVVIIQAIIQGWSQHSEYAPITHGIYYIIGAQFLGAFFGAIIYMVIGKLFHWFNGDQLMKLPFLRANNLVQACQRLKIKYPQLNHSCHHVHAFYVKYLRIEQKKNNEIKSIKLNEIIPEDHLTYKKFVIKEIIFLMPLLFITPFINYIWDTIYDTNAVYKVVFNILIVFLLLFLSQKYGYFMFNQAFSFGLLIVLIVTKAISLKWFTKFMIASCFYYLISWLAGLFYIKLAASTGINFLL